MKKLLLLPLVFSLVGCSSFKEGFEKGSGTGASQQRYLQEIKRQPGTVGLLAYKDSTLLRSGDGVCRQHEHDLPRAVILTTPDDTFSTDPALWEVVVDTALSRLCP